MKQKFLTFLTLFTLFFGVGWATETAYETLQFGKDYNYSGSQSYTSTWNAKSDKYEWILYGFNNNNTYSNGNGTWTYVKCGSKNSAVAATIKSKKAIDKAITKVVVTVDATKNSNGSKLEVASDADFNNILQTVNATLSAGNVTYTISKPTENCYYRLTFDQKKGSKGDTQISKVVCYYDPDASGGDTPQPTTYSLTLPTGLTGGSVTSIYSGDLTAIPANMSITVTATADTDYELDWMKANGTEVTNPYTFNINGNTTITAAFKEEQTTPIGDYVFYEPFTDSNGTNDSFGITNTNDGNGNDPKYVSGFGAFTATLGSIYGANDAIKAGTSKKKGKVKTPTITGLTDGATYTLTFNAAPWSSDNSSMSVDVTGGTLTGLSTASMTTGQWNAYTATFVASATSATFEFYATSSNRFFLDEVKLVAVASSAHSITLTQPETGGTISSDKLSAESGQTVTLSASNADGYELSSWTVTGVTSGNTITVESNNQFTMPDEDVTVTATFNPVNYNIYRTITAENPNDQGGWLGNWTNCTLPDEVQGTDYEVTSTVGQTVQFKAGNNEGYKILASNVTAKDASNNNVPLTVVSSDNSGITFSFTMPASAVTISAYFTFYQPDLYFLAGDLSNWDNGKLMTYDATAQQYSTRVFFADEYGYFRFRADNDTYASGAEGDYWGLNGSTSGESANLYKGSVKRYRVPAGIYDIVVNRNRNQVTVTRVEPEFTFSPAAGEVLEGTTVTATSTLGDLLHAIDSSVAAADATTQVSLAENGTYGASVTLDADGNVYARATYGQITYTSAPAAYTVTERGDYYEKVTSTTDLTDGEYLIVYEEGPVAFNGGLETLDAVHNYIDVTIEDDKIYATPTVDAAIFTWNATAGTLQSASGNYIGRTAASNGFNTSATANITNSITIEDGHAVITSTGGPKLQFFSNSGQERFRYYSSSQQAIQLYKKVSSTVIVAAPTFDPASGAELVSGDEVTITAAEGCTLKYTVNDGAEQTTTGNTATVVLTEDATIKATAVDGDNNESEEATATYTVLATTTLAELEANPEQGKSYVISDMLTVGYVAADGTAYAKDADVDIEVPAGVHDYVATQLTDRNHTNTTANWIAITGIDEVSEGQTIAANTLRGALTDAVNFTLAVSQQPELSDRPVEYDVNTYIPCNFMGQTTQQGAKGYTYFFSTPQVNEFAHITNAVLASKEAGGSGDADTYQMTIDSGTKNGVNNVHWTANNATLTWDGVNWNASYSGGKIYNQNNWIQIGSNDNPSTQIVLTTTGFAGKTITSASLTGYCMSTEGPTLTITAGSATMMSNVPLQRQSSGTTEPAVYTTSSNPVSLGAGDALTFTINSSANAGICLVGISVSYGEGSTTGTFNLGTGIAGANSVGLEGEITVDLGSLGESFSNVGDMYTFDALIKAAASGSGAPRRAAGNGSYSIQAVGNVSGNDIPTAVDELQSGKAVDGVRYVNVAGQVAATPWQGVNIVVTRYTDGSTRTTKVVK